MSKDRPVKPRPPSRQYKVRLPPDICGGEVTRITRATSEASARIKVANELNLRLLCIESIKPYQLEIVE